MKAKIDLWEERLQKSLSAFSDELEKMPEREAQYNGTKEVRPCTDKDKRKDGKTIETANVWNLTAENIEAEIDSSVPMPKISPMRRCDEGLARKIENMIRNEIDRLPTEKLNDQAERATKKQGCCGLLVEWDSTIRTHTTVGDVTMQVLHPTRIIPQAGCADLESSDYVFVLLPMTKVYVKNRWGVDVEKEGEEKPELRDSGTSDEIVTVKVATYKNGEGGIGQFIWVNNTPLSDLEDCQARRLRRCKKCGQTEIDNAYTMDAPTADGNPPEGKPRKARRDECSFCHSRSWESVKEEYKEVPLSDLERLGVRPEVIAEIEAKFRREAETTTTQSAALTDPITQGSQTPSVGFADSSLMEGADTSSVTLRVPPSPQGEDFEGLLPPDEFAIAEQVQAYNEPKVKIPYYTPNVFPLVMLYNVSALGKWMGESDCDKLADQQNTVNRMWSKILNRMLNAGAKIAVPPDARIEIDADDNEMIRVSKTTDLALLKQFEFTGNLQYEFQVLQKAGEEARNALGITESFLGKRDATANSAVAKQFAAQQTAGRLESKRVMKKLAFSQVYEIMFKYMIAYADEKRPMRLTNKEGDTEYEEFNAYEFLEVDDAGELYWNTDFLFACDDSSALAANREAMWQETTRIFQSGGLGNPKDTGTLIVYWTRMEQQHYPGAAQNRKIFEERREQEREMQMQAQMQQRALAAQTPQAAPMMQQTQGMPAGTLGG